jgi:hypothetical protein
MRNFDDAIITRNDHNPILKKKSIQLTIYFQDKT